MRCRALWIEDLAHTENARFSAPVYLSGRYDLTVALNATSAMSELSRNVYDAIIVDIRLPPGDDPLWIKEYTDRGDSTKAARLGLRLLEVVLDGSDTDNAWRGLTLPTAAREPHRYGILSVETKESLNLDRLRVGPYRNKEAAANARLLLELLDEVITHSLRG